MSAVPGDFMREPQEHDPPRASETPRPGAEDESRAGIWQWLALGVLLACWLAEATLCAAGGF